MTGRFEYRLLIILARHRLSQLEKEIASSSINYDRALSHIFLLERQRD